MLPTTRDFHREVALRVLSSAVKGDPPWYSEFLAYLRRVTEHSPPEHL